MININEYIAAFADKIGVPVSTVEFMANHVADTMGEEMAKEEDEAAQIELMRAGVQSSQRAMQALANKALTRSGEMQSVVYKELIGRL